MKGPVCSAVPGDSNVLLAGLAIPDFAALDERAVKLIAWMAGLTFLSGRRAASLGGASPTTKVSSP